MIQGGDPNSRNRDPRDDGTGGPGYTIDDEFSQVSHTRGMVSMANTGAPKSAGSQFFIVVADSPHLDGKYTLFGRVTEGMDVADRIVATERDIYGRHGPRDRPLENVVIAAIRIERPASTGDSTPTRAAESPAAERDEGDTGP
jgi:peptidyl-prolyl cis-trans isomerase B (cyclophilin B)